MQDITFANAPLDLPLKAHLHRPAQSEPNPTPLVIHVHGFKGFMDWGPWPWVAERITETGSACLRFNFSHNGIGHDPEAFTEDLLFQDNTFSREVLELGAVLEGAAALPGIDPTRITLLGHSRGGAIALLAAAQAPQVKAVITWAGVAGFEGLLGFGNQKDAWRRDGYIPVKNARTGQVMRVGVALLEDWEANRSALNVTAAVRALFRADRSVTAIQGVLDPVVTVEQAERLAAAGARLVLVPGADHTFGATHPFQAAPPAPLLAAMEATLAALAAD